MQRKQAETSRSKLALNQCVFLKEPRRRKTLFCRHDPLDDWGKRLRRRSHCITTCSIQARHRDQWLCDSAFAAIIDQHGFLQQLNFLLVVPIYGGDQ